MKRKGVVSKIGKSQYSYFIQLDGDGFYFNTKYEPKVGVGDTVGIEYDKKGDKRGQIKKVVLLTDSGSPKGYQQSSSGGSGQRSGGGYSGGGNDDARQASIIYQSSRKDALVLVGLILGAEAIALPKNPDGRRTVIEALVDEVTLRFVKDATDPSNALSTAKSADGDADSSNESGGDDWDEGGDGDEEWDDSAEWE